MNCKLVLHSNTIALFNTNGTTRETATLKEKFKSLMEQQK